MGTHQPQITSCKYQGIALQNNLRWDTCINNITTNYNRALGLVGRNLQIHTQHAIRTCVQIYTQTPTGVWNPHHTKYILLFNKIHNAEQHTIPNQPIPYSTKVQ